MLRNIPLKTNYSSEADDIYSDFFRPVLSEASTYRRAVGFFSPAVLLHAPAALSRLVEENGRVELIFGRLVSPDDFDAIRAGVTDPWLGAELPSFKAILDEHPESLLHYRVRLLAWLFAAGRLEMKVAIRPTGMFHQKIGLLTDGAGDTVSFSGSMNETISAVDPRFNSEEITVFKSWEGGQAEYVANHRAAFDTLWSGETGSRTVITSVPEAIEAGLNFVSERFPDKPTTDEEDEKVKAFIARKAERHTSEPRVPSTMHGQPFEMRRHQLDALKAWAANGYSGILELATGAGKTVTAIYAAVKTIENNDGIALIVAVPYQDLADQWCRELETFNISPLRCYGARGEWEPALRAYLKRNRHEQREFLPIVVVNKTLGSAHFQNCLSELDGSRTFFIGDECHHHSAEGFEGKLMPEARFRIGLSATPFHYLDEEKNERLRQIYDKSVYEYTLADAVRDKVLTPYEYHPIGVELTDAETVEYLELSDQIARIFARAQNDKGGATQQQLKALLMRRSRLVGAAANKLPALEGLLSTENGVDPYSLFYCGDGRTQLDIDDFEDADSASEDLLIKQRHAVTQLLGRRGVRVSPFTSEENRKQRREILSRFRDGETEALVAIRCLDEGIDVPACRTAYLIASSRNPRQFVQRRGRILRRSPGKDYAKIYDFVVVLPENSISSKTEGSDFLKNELGRVADFARGSLYPASSIEPLMPWLRKYRLEHLAA
jgi:superfamily II DNA or RNA helicase